jgi:acyl carrier protein
MSWTHDQIVTELIRVIHSHVDDCERVESGSELVGDLGIDSLGVMELVADLEDSFSLVINEADLRDVATIGDVAKAVETRLQQAGRLQA